MTHRNVLHDLTRCVVCSSVIAILAGASGCGGVSSEATLDKEAQARVQAAEDAQKKFMEKHKPGQGKAARRPARLSPGDL